MNPPQLHAVDDVLAAFSDHLNRGTPLPALDYLEPRDRQLAEDLMRLMETARRIDPSALAPSLDALLAGTEFADALATGDWEGSPRRKEPDHG
jgi:hypothetical protein